MQLEEGRRISSLNEEIRHVTKLLEEKHKMRESDVAYLRGKLAGLQWAKDCLLLGK